MARCLLVYPCWKAACGGGEEDSGEGGGGGRSGDELLLRTPPPNAWDHACPGARLQAGASLTVKTAGAEGKVVEDGR